MIMSMAGRIFVSAAVLFCAACAHQAPTIAHIHVGHAITGAYDTPGKVGYLTLASQEAEQALAHAEAAANPTSSLDRMKLETAATNAITNTEGTYPLTGAVREAADHIEFAAMSDDASANIRAGYEQFKATVEGVLYRGGLIDRYALDVAGASTEGDARPLVTEIQKLAYANVHGEDLDGDGRIGTTAREYGLSQISAELDALVARENPPYETVDRWYLFNLIRLPSGEWIFRRSGSSASRGY
jgi:hypothetical protein